MGGTWPPDAWDLVRYLGCAMSCHEEKGRRLRGSSSNTGGGVDNKLWNRKLRKPSPYSYTLAVRELMANSEMPVAPVEGLVNFRDIGGYRNDQGCVVRRERVYRSGNLHGLGENGLRQLGSLGICAVFDLRSTRERNERPARLPRDRKSTRLNSSHSDRSRMPSSA